MIHTYDFYSMRLNECNGFGKRIIEQVKKYNQETMGLLPLVSPIEATIEKLSEGLNRVGTQLETMTVKEADNGRDNSVSGLVMYCKAFTYSHDLDKKAAAERLLTFLKAFGSIYKANYEEASSKVRDMLRELDDKTPLKHAIGLIGATPFVEQLRLAQRRFDMVAEERLDVVSARPDYNNRETAKELKEHLDTLFQFLEVMQKIAPNPDFGLLSDRINTIIDETMNKIHIREGRRAAQQEGS